MPEDEWLKGLYLDTDHTVSHLRAGITPVSPEYLRLDNDHNELKKKLVIAQQEQQRAAQELDEAHKQLEVPKLTLSVVAFEAYEEKSTQTYLKFSDQAT